MSARPRDAYEDVGRAIRQAYARARELGVTEAEKDVVAAIVELVGSYSRLADRVPVEQIAKVTGRHDKTVKAALRRLASGDRPVLVYVPGCGRPRHDRPFANVSLVGLPAAENGAAGGSLSEAEKGAKPRSEKGAKFDSEKGAARDSLPEKTSEKTDRSSGDVAISEDLAAAFRRAGIVLHASQLEQAIDGWNANAQLVERLAAESEDGDSPAGLFMSKLSAARNSGLLISEHQRFEQRLERWLATTASESDDEDWVRLTLQDDFGLDADRVKMAVSRWRELRGASL